MDVSLGLRRLGYRRARVLLLLVGLAGLLLLAGLTYARRVETVEVVAVLLFIPVFVALVFWGPWGGTIAGALAAGVYILLRLPAIDAVGLDPFLGVIASRSVALIAFGAVGGWASRQLETSVRKLELYDHIDDETGLLNARFFLEETDLETSRSDRYQTIFSVALAEFPASAFDGAPARRRRSALRGLARELRQSIRTVDRAVHGGDGRRHLIAVVLPETGPEGAQIFTHRLGDRVAEHLRGASASFRRETVLTRWATYPEDAGQLRAFREDYRRIDRLERPELPS